MGFVVLHMEKAHGSDSGTTAHIERFIILFIIGGLVLLVITLNKVHLARALAANGGKIVVDADSVTYPIIKKGEKTDKY